MRKCIFFLHLKVPLFKPKMERASFAYWPGGQRDSFASKKRVGMAKPKKKMLKLLILSGGP